LRKSFLWLLTLPAAIPLHIAGRIVNRQVLKRQYLEIATPPLDSHPPLAAIPLHIAGRIVNRQILKG
jgi:hypothetical protein